MLEIPEAIVVSNQLNETIAGKEIVNVIVAASPHKFAWFYEDPAEYHNLLFGRKIEKTAASAGRIDIQAQGATLSFGDGAILRYYEPDEKKPAKHQLYVEFQDGSALVVTVAMYGGIWAFPNGAMDDDMYRKASLESISPLSDDFSYEYFLTLFDEQSEKMSAKAFLATKQRIPGLGNGVLQDILLNARLNPRTKMNTLSESERRFLFDCIKSTLKEMTDNGGRDTETDLFGNKGGYKTKLSRNTKFLICPICGGPVHKEAYMGGSVYYCDICQPKRI